MGFIRRYEGELDNLPSNELAEAMEALIEIDAEIKNSLDKIGKALKTSVSLGTANEDVTTALEDAAFHLDNTLKLNDQGIREIALLQLYETERTKEIDKLTA